MALVMKNRPASDADGLDPNFGDDRKGLDERNGIY